MTARKPPNPAKIAREERIAIILRAHWSGPLSLADLARRCGCSLSSVQRNAAKLGLGNREDARDAARLEASTANRGGLRMPYNRDLIEATIIRCWPGPETYREMASLARAKEDTVAHVARDLIERGLIESERPHHQGRRGHHRPPGELERLAREEAEILAARRNILRPLKNVLTPEDLAALEAHYPTRRTA